jgi:hypothetical protein
MVFGAGACGGDLDFLREEKGRDVGVREGIGEEGEGIREEGGEVGGCECVQMGRNIWIKW